jgi:hypothetical protein
MLGLVLGMTSLVAGQFSQTVIDEGSRVENEIKVEYSVSLYENAPPGTPLLADFTKWGDSPSVATLVRWYYAGLEGRTIHLYRITTQQQRGEFVETERLPVLLPLAQDDTTMLSVHPMKARPFRLRIKKNQDMSLSGTVVK